MARPMAAGVAGGLLALLLAPAPAVQAQSDVIRFDWALGALSGPSRTFVSIGREATLQSGDQLKMFVRLKERGFVYVIFHDTADGLTLLHPAAIQAVDPAVGVGVYIPRGASWMQLDARPGKETIYLLASSARLQTLEDALGQYARSSPAGRPDLARQALEAIGALREQFRPAQSPVERPVEIAGRVRGLQTDVASFATEVSARRFYSRTITIDHR